MTSCQTHSRSCGRPESPKHKNFPPYQLGKLRRRDIYIKKQPRLNAAAGISDLGAAHVRDSECATITSVHE